MAARTSIEQREAFIERHAKGETFAEIAQVYGVSWPCVRFWWQRFRRGEGVTSHYVRERHSLLMRFTPLVRYGILRLKIAHRHWGSRRIRYHLQQRPSLVGHSLPSATQIGRYLPQWARFRRPARRKRAPRSRPACPPMLAGGFQAWPCHGRWHSGESAHGP